MLARVFAHVRQQWLGFVALLLVLTGGTAYAVNTVGSSDIIDESIQSQDIKNREVGTNDLAIGSVWGSRIRDNAILSAHVVDNVLTSSDIMDNSLTGGDLMDNSLTGDDLDEASLGKVPDADKLDGKDASEFLALNGKAADADKLDGLDKNDFVDGNGIMIRVERRLNGSGDIPGPATNLGLLDPRVRCDANKDVRVNLYRRGNDSGDVTASWTRAGDEVPKTYTHDLQTLPITGFEFSTGDDFLGVHDDEVAGTLTAMRTDGVVLTLTFMAHDYEGSTGNRPGSGQYDCAFAGNAILSPG